MSGTDDPTPPRSKTPRDEPERHLPPSWATPPEAPQTAEESPTPNTDAPPATARTQSRLTAPTGATLSAYGLRATSTADAAGPSRTGTSDTTGERERTKVSAADAAGLVAGVLALLATIAGGVVKWQTGQRRELREPTKTQRRDIAAPVARILMRHADLAMLGPDLGDVLEAAAATGAYVGDGPLVRPATIDAGIPADLQEETE